MKFEWIWSSQLCFFSPVENILEWEMERERVARALNNWSICKTKCSFLNHLGPFGVELNARCCLNMIISAHNGIQIITQDLPFISPSAITCCLLFAMPVFFSHIHLHCHLLCSFVSVVWSLFARYIRFAHTQIVLCKTLFEMLLLEFLISSHFFPSFRSVQFSSVYWLIWMSSIVCFVGRFASGDHLL